MPQMAAASRTGDLRAMHPEGPVVVQLDGPGSIGSQKLGQPVPDSYFVAELNRRPRIPRTCRHRAPSSTHTRP
jgi:hypothetical protein